MSPDWKYVFALHYTCILTKDDNAVAVFRPQDDWPTASYSKAYIPGQTRTSRPLIYPVLFCYTYEDRAQSTTQLTKVLWQFPRGIISAISFIDHTPHLTPCALVQQCHGELRETVCPALCIPETTGALIWLRDKVPAWLLFNSKLWTQTGCQVCPYKIMFNIPSTAVTLQTINMTYFLVPVTCPDRRRVVQLPSHTCTTAGTVLTA